MKEKIDYSDIPETDEDFWEDAKLMKSVKTRLSKENYEFLLALKKPFEQAINEIIDVHRELYELAKTELQKNEKKTA
ncbi:MAG: hypothetical protein L3J74_03675 [Bacteroidales bacterium]|nr:hypothetical protein [Bacteroidales bacterium]